MPDASSTSEHPTVVYKLLEPPGWAQWTGSGKFSGAAIDLTDGFIHLSTAEQGLETYEKYFASEPDTVLVSVDLAKVEDEVKWEPSRNGLLFAHVYGSIPIGAAGKVKYMVTKEIMEALKANGKL